MILSSLVVQFCLVLLEPLIVASVGDNMIGPGEWRVVSVGPCAQEYEVAIAVARRKVNRTHDGFTAKITTDQEINDSCGVRVDVCKWMDGGCKPYQVLADESLPRYVRKYAADNARDFLASGGLESADFPIPKGELVVSNYVFNYAELPADGIYGEFGATAYLVRGARDVACLHLELVYSEKEDDEER